MKTDALLWEASVISSHRHPAVSQVASVPVYTAAILGQSPNQILMTFPPESQPHFLNRHGLQHVLTDDWGFQIRPTLSPPLSNISILEYPSGHDIVSSQARGVRTSNFIYLSFSFALLNRDNNRGLNGLPRNLESKWAGGRKGWSWIITPWAHHWILVDKGTHRGKLILFFWGQGDGSVS